MRQVANGVWMGTGTSVNWMVVRDGGQLTLVDSGYPGDLGQLEASLAEVGHRPSDITAVLLTHAHVDHTGGLNALREHYGVPVFMHPEEVPLARGERREQATTWDVVSRSWRPRVATWGWQILRAGAMTHPVIGHARAWDADGALDLPGCPVPVPCSGHTSGHTAYLFVDRGVIATGDALVTGHPVSGKHTPHLLPGFFNTSTDEARAALARLAAVDADTIVPGHGPVWMGSLRLAADAAAADHDYC